MTLPGEEQILHQILCPQNARRLMLRYVSYYFA